MIKKTVKALALVLLSSAPAAAQSTCPSIAQGAVLSAGQWNACFAAKQDALGFTPLSNAGGTLSGALITTPSISGAAGLNIPPGIAPSAPNNGDLWTTSAGLYVQINGSTVGPLVANANVSVTYGTTTVALGGASTSIAGLTELSLTSALGATVDWNSDTFIGRAAAASVRLGAADAAAPVAQALGAQNVIAGTSNTAGASLTIKGSQGTGTGAGGTILLQTAPAGGSGTSQNSLITAATVGTGVGVGSAAADPGAGIVNVTTGYRVANAATSGTVLRGNGTTYVSGSQQQIIPLSNAGLSQSQNTTDFEVSSLLSVEASVQSACPFSGTFKNLYIISSAPASGQTLTSTWRVNGSDTGITCVITGTGTTCNDTTHTAACTAGQSYSLKTVTSATSGTLTSIAGGIEFDIP